MKCVFVIMLFVSSFITAQEIYIIDSISGVPIENVSLFNKHIGVSSNNQGMANLNVFAHTDTIKIKHISYQIKQILCSNINKNILLSPKTTMLPTVVFKENSDDWAIIHIRARSNQFTHTSINQGHPRSDEIQRIQT